MGSRESKASAKPPSSGMSPDHPNNENPRGCTRSAIADDENMPTSRAVPVLRGPLPDLIRSIWSEDSPQPAVQIRCAIALYLASSPDRRLGPLRVQLPNMCWHLRRNHRDLWLNPAHNWPKLKVLMLSPESRDAFLCQKDEEGRDVVVLNVAALQEAAVAPTAMAAAEVERCRRTPPPAQHADAVTLSALPAEPAALAAAAVDDDDAPPPLPQPPASSPAQNALHGPVGSSALPPAAIPGRVRPTGRPAAAAAATAATAAASTAAVAPITTAAAAVPPLNQDEQVSDDLQLLVRRALAVDPRFNEKHVRMLRATAFWLATSPQPSLGPYSATLTDIRAFLKREHAGFWYDPGSQRRPPLGELLKGPVAQGIFHVVKPVGSAASEVVSLRFEALRLVAASVAPARPARPRGGAAKAEAKGIAPAAPAAAAAGEGPGERVDGLLHEAAPQKVGLTKKERKTTRRVLNPRATQLGAVEDMEVGMESQQPSPSTGWQEPTAGSVPVPAAPPSVLKPITNASAAAGSEECPAGSGSAPARSVAFRTAPIRTSSAATAPPMASPASVLSPGLSLPSEGPQDADAGSGLPSGAGAAATTTKAAATAVAASKEAVLAASASASAVAAAVAAAWPGGDAASRVRRRAAELLAAVTQTKAAAERGGAGQPYTMLMTRIGQLLHASEPDALTEWRAAAAKAAGSTKLGSLLNEKTVSRTAAPSDASADSDGGSTSGGGTTERRAYLNVTSGVVQLDLEALLADAAGKDHGKQKRGGAVGAVAGATVAVVSGGRGLPGNSPSPSSRQQQQQDGLPASEAAALEAAAAASGATADAAAASVSTPAGTAARSVEGGGSGSDDGSGDAIADAVLVMATGTALSDIHSVIEVAATVTAAEARTAGPGSMTISDDGDGGGGADAAPSAAALDSSDDTTVSSIADGSGGAVLVDGEAPLAGDPSGPSSSPLPPPAPPPPSFLAEDTPTRAPLQPPTTGPTEVEPEAVPKAEPEAAELHGTAASDVPAAAAAIAVPQTAAAAAVYFAGVPEAPPPLPPPLQQQDSGNEGDADEPDAGPSATAAIATAAAAAVPASSAAALPMVVTDAVSQAWPHSDTACRLRRLAAMALLEGGIGTAEEGPLGPWSLLWAQMAARIHKEVPNAHQHLLEEFPAGTFRNKKTVVRTVTDESSFSPSPAAAASEAPRGAFLRVVHHVYDYVIQLDLPALLNWAMERRLETLWEASVESAAAKRCIARLLAAAAPPYQLPFTRLGSYIRKLLAGQVVRGLQKLCMEDPNVFVVSLQSKDHYVVRLVDEQLLGLAAALEDVSRKVADGSVGGRDTETTATAAGAPAAASPSATPAAAPAAAAAAFSAPVPRPPSSYAELNEREPKPLESKTKPKPQAPKTKSLKQRSVSVSSHKVTRFEVKQQQQQQQTTTTTTTNQQRKKQRRQKDVDGLGIQLQPHAEEQPTPTLAAEAEAVQQQPLATAVDGGTVYSGVQQQQEDLSVPIPMPVPLPIPIPVPCTGEEMEEEEPAPSTMEPYISNPEAEAEAAMPDRVALQADIAATAASAVRWLLGYEHPNGGGLCAWATAALAGCSVQAVVDPYGPEAGTMRDHCRTCTQVGLAVQSCGGQPVLVAVYAPATVAWPAAAVYLVDCTACTALFGGLTIGQDLLRVLLTSLRGLLEDPVVTKVVHGCDQVHCLEAACGGAVTAPLVDTRVLLSGISFMLGLPPVPPSPGQHQQQQQLLRSLHLTRSNLLYDLQAELAAVHDHVSQLYNALKAIGLWSERPGFLEALMQRHYAGMRARMLEARVREEGRTGSPASAASALAAVMAELWLPRPLGLAQVAVLASCVTALPEIWLAMVEEAVLWVAVHAPMHEMQRLRSTAVAATAPSPPPPSQHTTGMSRVFGAV